MENPTLYAMYVLSGQRSAILRSCRIWLRTQPYNKIHYLTPSTGWATVYIAVVSAQIPVCLGGH